MKYAIADPPRESILLVMRRAWWAAAKTSIPRYKGYIIAPQYVPRADQEAQQERWRVWWESLDPKSQAFLGPGYKAFAIGPERKQ